MTNKLLLSVALLLTLIKTGSDIPHGTPAHLKANEQNEISACLNKSPCSPMPAFLNVSGIILTTKDYEDPNQTNNDWKGRVSVPF